MTPPAAVATAHAPARTRRSGGAVPAPSRRPRRVSGPARPVALPAPRGRVLDAAVLDRLMFGRAWIALIAAALMGLVFLQVSLLNLNTGIGRAVTAEATLERQNALLRTEVAKLESGERIEAVAAKLGLVMPGADRVNYLTAKDADAARAARSIRAPEPVAQEAAALTAAGTAATAAQAPVTAAPSPVPTPAATQTPVATPAPTPTPTPTPQAAPTQQAATQAPAAPQQTQATQQDAAPPSQQTATATATGGAATP